MTLKQDPKSPMHIDIKFTKEVQTQPKNVSLDITVGNVQFR